MTADTLKSPPPRHFALLTGVLHDAARTLPEAERTPSVMACVAEKLLALAAKGETNPVSLRRVALETVLETCGACRGCKGLTRTDRVPHHFQEANTKANLYNRSW